LPATDAGRREPGLASTVGNLFRSAPKPKLHDRDRRFWILLARLWPGWRSALLIVAPATVVRWHRQGFRFYWRWKSRGRPGRPQIDADVRQLIRRLSRENPLWGAPRIQAELCLLGHDLAESTVAKYMVRRRDQSPSQTWKTVLHNHVGTLAAIDFCVVPLPVKLGFKLSRGRTLANSEWSSAYCFERLPSAEVRRRFSALPWFIAAHIKKKRLSP